MTVFCTHRNVGYLKANRAVWGSPMDFFRRQWLSVFQITYRTACSLHTHSRFLSLGIVDTYPFPLLHEPQTLVNTTGKT
jgi:hypothetical protein